MSEPFTGGCACGAIRYEISGEPLVQFDCQCRDCQRMSGTGHGSYLAFPRANESVVSDSRLSSLPRYARALFVSLVLNAHLNLG